MSTENLYSKEAKEKIKELVENIEIAMMTTNLGHKPLSAIPMYTKKVDENGNIWFLSGADSDHNKDIENDTDVQLLYAKPSDKEFLSVFGKAMVTRDKTVLKDLYGSGDDNWFDGVDDPNLTAISFKPIQAQYWDTKHNKYITLFKIMYGATTGEDVEIGVSGRLKP